MSDFTRPPLTPEELAAKEAREGELAPKLEAEWKTFADRGRSPYMDRKLIPDLFGARLMPNPNGDPIVAIPLRDADGKFWNFQRIYSTKFKQADGAMVDKFTTEGARSKGTFFLLGGPKVIGDSETIYICEGYATATSVYQALGIGPVTVAVALYAANLPDVASQLRARHPTSPIVICADNDKWKPGSGNAGREWAEKAREAIGENVFVRYPVFPGAQADPESGKGPTDFNDLHCLHGLETVKAQLENQAEERKGKAGPPIPAKGAQESLLVHAALDAFGDRLVRQGKDFFVWETSHWRHIDPLSAPDKFRKLIDHKAGGKLKYKDINSAFQRFCLHVPHVPADINIFSPNPLKQSFSNGTLELVLQDDGTFKQSFRSHQREDWLTHCHDFEYRRGAPYNAEFEASLDRIWEGDPDRDTKKKAYFEVLGACLLPAFRKVVLFKGKPKSGKSTLVLFATQLVNPLYRCSVDPSQFKKFNFESMAGKLLNFDTDINLTEPIGDSILKKIEDRIPLRIERKGLADIYAPIPGMHLFAANRMPVSREGGQAYDRRMIVFPCESYHPGAGAYRQDYAGWVWDLGAQGIVERALEGLDRLCKSGGHFTIPDSSEAAIREWQGDQADLVAAFLADWREGEVLDVNNKPMEGDRAEISRPHLWEIFKVWAEKTAPRQTHASRNKFYARLRELGIHEKIVEGDRRFFGLGVQSSRGADI